jgi:hypothetical protein
MTIHPPRWPSKGGPTTSLPQGRQITIVRYGGNYLQKHLHADL